MTVARQEEAYRHPTEMGEQGKMLKRESVRGRGGRGYSVMMWYQVVGEEGRDLVAPNKEGNSVRSRFPDEEVDKIRCMVMGGIMTESFPER
jgi:hypothetical protein